MSAADAPRDATPPLAVHPHRIVIDAGVLVALAGLSLSFASSGAGGRPWSLRDGLVLLGLLAPLVVLTVLPDRTRPLPSPHRLIAAGLMALAVPYSIVKLLEALTLAGALDGSIGFGPVLVLIGVGAAGVGVALTWRQRAEYLPPPPARRAPSGELPGPPGGRERRPVEPEPTRETSWLDENPFGEPLFDSLEFDVPRSRHGEPPPEDYDEPWPIEEQARDGDGEPGPAADRDDPPPQNLRG